MTKRGIGDEIGSSLGLFPAIADRIITPVDHIDTAVVTRFIFRSDPTESALESMVESGNLIPLPQVPLQLETINRHHPLWETGASGQDYPAKQEEQPDDIRE